MLALKWCPLSHVRTPLPSPPMATSTSYCRKSIFSLCCPAPMRPCLELVFENCFQMGIASSLFPQPQRHGCFVDWLMGLPGSSIRSFSSCNLASLRARSSVSASTRAAGECKEFLFQICGTAGHTAWEAEEAVCWDIHETPCFSLPERCRQRLLCSLTSR